MLQANLTARRAARDQLAAFTGRTDGCTLDAVDDEDFPSRFTITFQASGFAPPTDELARPQHPVPRYSHTVEIALPPDYPVGDPVMTWLSPVFHPNIANGAVCLALGSPDVAAACQAAIDLAAYQNYEVRPEDFGGGGFLNLAAAAWTLSPEGQQAIIDAGGTPLATRRRLQPRLTITAVDD